MSRKIYVELNSAGVQELLKSAEVQETLKTYARDMAVLGDGDIDVRIGQKRAYISAHKDLGKTERYDEK